ncbi:MAG: rhombosortase [Proteobacteria bacterium]|nr:rhombosortase [Pseudomonadota bacterium]
MGLSQGAVDARKKADFFVCLTLGMALALAAAIELSGDLGREWLRYDRAAIADGELWRLLGGHWVHLGWSHFLLNGIGLLLIAYLVAANFSRWQWLMITAAVIAGIDLGFWFLQPQLVWYVGMSGLLHGLLAAGTVNGLRCRPRESWLIAAFLVGKLGYEQLLGPLPGSEETTGGNVVVAAHLYGAMSGALAGLCFSFRKSPDAPI